MEPAEQFVRASLNGDAVTAGSTFNDLMRDKIAGQIDALRQTTAASLVAAPEEQEQTEVEDGSDDSEQ